MRYLLFISVLLTGISSHAQVSPLACYPLNGNANDYSGNSINGTITGAVPAVDRHGNSNGCYYFDGASRIEITNPALFTAQQWTFSFWLKVNAYPAAGNSMVLLSLGSVGGDQIVGINNDYLSASHGWISTTYTSSSTNAVCSWPVLPTLDMWYHWVTVRDADSIRIYLNNIQVSKLKTNSTTSFYGTGTPQGFIGSRYNYSHALIEEFIGSIDDVRIYSSALSPTDIYALYTEDTECDGTTNIFSPAHQQEEINITPNPVQSETTINVVNGREIDSWTLTNAQGILVQQQSGIRRKSFTIDLSSLSSGIYHLIIMDPSGTMYTQKIVKE